MTANEAAPLSAEAGLLVLVLGTLTMVALVLALRDPSRFPEAYRSAVLWARSNAPVAPGTRAALRTDPDIDGLTAATLRCGPGRPIREASDGSSATTRPSSSRTWRDSVFRFDAWSRTAASSGDIVVERPPSPGATFDNSNVTSTGSSSSPNHDASAASA